MPIPQSPLSWPEGESIPASKHASRVNQEQEQAEIDGNVKTQMMNVGQPHRIHGVLASPVSSKPGTVAQCTDRAELMLRIKRGESPQWVPNENLQLEYLKENFPLPQSLHGVGKPAKDDPSLLLAPETLDEATESQVELASPAEIDRPRSALHSGDFKQAARNQTGTHQGFTASSTSPLHGVEDASGCPTAAKLAEHEDIAPWAFAHARRPSTSCRRRSANFSFSNYRLTQPTTPLVQQSTSSDVEQLTREGSASPDRSTRRHTLPPQSLYDWQTLPHDKGITQGQFLFHEQRESSLATPQPARRSITFPWTLQASSPPSAAFLRSRRTSFSSEASPRQHASMVGSYEESILHGRMSTAPSKPFDFQANIGVLGRGKKPKMPPHVTVPFQAVFYDWSVKSRLSSICDEPSPYVGEIDLCKSGPVPCPDRRRYVNKEPLSVIEYSAPTPTGDVDPQRLELTPKKRKSHHLAPEGSYRIPEQGQLQVVIKNPYKTALKLFLVPYDLTGIKPGQKTFVRQRYYSRGPIIERPVSVGMDEMKPKAPSRPILRYLIHLKMCCPFKGYFCLYSNIRVVFANRVPDDKEHLSKEVQEPNPKFSLWKPYPSSPRNITPPSKINVDISLRRRSLGGNPIFGPDLESARKYKTVDPYTDTSIPPIPPIPPLLLNPNPADHRSRQGVRQCSDQTDSTSSDANNWDEKPDVDSSQVQDNQTVHRGEDYIKLRKGEAGYGGSRSGTPQPGESLLARRLRHAVESRECSPFERYS